MLFITFHGGKSSGSAKPINNVQAYKDTGELMEANVLNGADAQLKDAELRGICFAYGGAHENHLYVVNGRKDQNTILRFKGTGTKYDLTDVFVSQSSVVSIFHPFAIAFDGSKFAYVSNQDNGIVVRLQVNDPKGKTASAAPTAPALPAGTFFAGTFVACANGNLPGLTPTTPIATPAGLEVELVPPTGTQKVQNSVRDALLINNHLYVCDEVADRIKVYDATGKFLLESDKVPKPAHLLAFANQLYVSGGDQVLSAAQSATKLKFSAVHGVEGKGASGMTFKSTGEKFFVADRTGNSVTSYDVSKGKFSNPKTILSGLSDNPEFLLYVHD